MSLKRIEEILRDNGDLMLKTNVIGSDFSFMKKGSLSLVFKIEPMVYYGFLTPSENAALSLTFPMNDFRASGTEPAIAMVDMERPTEAGTEYFEYIKLLFAEIRKRRMKIASGHTGSYGNVGYGVSGTMALLGFDKPVFSFKQMREDDVYYSIGTIGTEYLFFLSKIQRKRARLDVSRMSIETYVPTLISNRKMVHYIHDISEGGLLRALAEISLLSKKGFDVSQEKLECVSEKGIKGMGSRLISVSSSGALVVSVDHTKKDEFERVMEDKSWPHMEIETKTKGITLDGERVDYSDDLRRILPLEYH